MTFELLATDGAARRGRLTTAHGVVETPVFMPVGTRATVKSLTPDDVRESGARIVLANTYHLFLRPGHALIRELGGLHRFMGWDGPILTDSGGFQVFSLSKFRRVSEEGVRFRSPVDGAEHVLSPENVVAVQQALGSDVMMPLDECLAYPATREATEASLALTLRWARRSQAARRAGAESAQALFGIVQGGSFVDLRRRAVDETVALGFEGYAIGGLAVGEPKPLLYDLTALAAEALPADRARYLMGVGKPEDLVEAVACGVDMFDCVLPTRNARNGQAFTADGPLSIKQARFAQRSRPPRGRLPVLRLPPVLPGLPAPPVDGAGTARLPAAVAPQSPLLRAAHGGDARGHRGGGISGIQGSVFGPICSIIPDARPHPRTRPHLREGGLILHDLCVRR